MAAVNHHIISIINLGIPYFIIIMLLSDVGSTFAFGDPLPVAGTLALEILSTGDGAVAIATAKKVNNDITK